MFCKANSIPSFLEIRKTNVISYARARTAVAFLFMLSTEPLKMKVRQFISLCYCLPTSGPKIFFSKADIN